MGRKLYVGNLPYSATEASLREAFSASGTVEDGEPDHRSRHGPEQGLRLRRDVDGPGSASGHAGDERCTPIDGRQIKVSEAKPKTSGGSGGPGATTPAATADATNPLAIDTFTPRRALAPPRSSSCPITHFKEIRRWPGATSNSQTKRSRELAKKDKRAVKDEKRAQKKADARAARASAVGKPAPASLARAPAANPAAAPNSRALAAAAFVRRMNKTP